MNLPFRGLITPLATPLAPSHQAEPSLDALGLERLIEHVIAGGVHGVFLLGSTGEFPSLGREMRQEVIRRACAQVNRRIPVLAGITDTAVSETLRLAETAAEAGADAVVLSAPYYFDHSQADLLRYLEQITARLPLPVFVYNIPPYTKNSYEPETVRRAADLPGVIGLKDSTGDLNYLKETVHLLRDRPKFGILIGPEGLLVESMKLGATGGVCGGSNLFPKLFVELYDAIVRGDMARAEVLNEKVGQMNRALYCTGYPAASYMRGIKAALALAGICNPDTATPYAPFSEEEYALVEKGYRSLDLNSFS